MKLIEYFKWVDACSVDEWHPADEDPKVAMCHAAGIVVAENDDAVKVAVSYQDAGDCCCALIIPKVCLVEREILGELEQEDA